MSATISFGPQPFPLVVNLPPDADFVQTLTNKSGWDADIGIELRFVPFSGPAIVWAAVVAEQSASWLVDSADVVAVIDSQPSQVRLHYIDASGDDLLWAVGRVNVLS